MLKSLHLSNIILIEKADIAFHDGLNVLSGETGSGKSAVMGALNYIAGERADLNILRHEAEKGIIQASFDIDTMPAVKKILEDSGIEHQAGEELIIRREISRTGKSRAFINHQLAQVSLLKRLGDHLLEIVGQHANQRLMDLSQHREILDLYADSLELRNLFTATWEEENQLKFELSTLIKNESQRLREIEICRMELEELEAAQIKDEEEEELFAEYTRLVNSEELSTHADGLYQLLNGEEAPILPAIKRAQSILKQIVQLDSTLNHAENTLASILLELEEIVYSVRNYRSGIEFQPERLLEINERLSLINKLKKKYGPTIKDVQNYRVKAKEKLSTLENADIHTEELQKRIAGLEKQNDAAAQKLTKKRTDAAGKLEKEMKVQMSLLNMPKAEFFVSILPQARSRFGDDAIEFHFSPNTGEKVISIRQCASGGELSRLMLALQTLLAGKEKIPTLIFDEIDANIGGETAAVVGDKLREIGGGHQVLCITHFPQVANCAHHHLQISKHEAEGRTYTTVKSLNEKERKHELARMSGKKAKS